VGKCTVDKLVELKFWDIWENRGSWSNTLYYIHSFYIQADNSSFNKSHQS